VSVKTGAKIGVEWYKIMTTRKALIVGATGLVGGFCLQALLDDSNYSEVIALVRKPLLKTHRKLKTIITTFEHLEPEISNIQVNDVYCCLGTTIKKAGSQEAFKRIDHTLVVTVAELTKKPAAGQFVCALHWFRYLCENCSELHGYITIEDYLGEKAMTRPVREQIQHSV